MTVVVTGWPARIRADRGLAAGPGPGPDFDYIIAMHLARARRGRD